MRFPVELLETSIDKWVCAPCSLKLVRSVVQCPHLDKGGFIISEWG